VSGLRGHGRPAIVPALRAWLGESAFDARFVPHIWLLPSQTLDPIWSDSSCEGPRKRDPGEHAGLCFARYQNGGLETLAQCGNLPQAIPRL
jgi:hypothetical protein